MKTAKRICVLYFIILFCLLFLFLKLYILSCTSNKALTVLDGQYSSRLDIAQRSGYIYDRYFEILSHDVYTGILIINPSECVSQDIAQDVSKIALVSTQSYIAEKIYDGVPFTVSVSNTEAAKRLCKKYTGLYYSDILTENNTTAPHLLGYSNGNEGITGLRREYSPFLYGQMASVKYATFTHNAINQSMSPLTITDDGFDKAADGIITSLDKQLQSFCDGLEKDIKSGCIVVADSTNGNILAISSFPTYDLQSMPEYLSSSKGELVNRALYSFAPGSVFKIIVCCAALEDSIDYYSFSHDCKGSIQVHGTTFNCHKLSGHGKITMKQAFAASCNCYFIALARELGYDKIISTAKKAGLDTAVSADFLTEADHAFTDESNTAAANLANISIGQGDLCLSPLDMINVTICACTGFTQKLDIILGTVEDGKAEYKKENGKRRVFSEKTVSLMCRMMEECVKTGTGMSCNIEGRKMGGKTATAQTGRFNGDGVEYVHKWFCGFFDGVDKRYVFCVLSDNTTEKNISPAVICGNLCRFFEEKRY